MTGFVILLVCWIAAFTLGRYSEKRVWQKRLQGVHPSEPIGNVFDIGRYP